MEQTVYADLFFLINFSMDFLCLFLTAKLLSRPLELYRGILAAVLGGIYAVAELVFLSNSPYAAPISVVVCLLMCFIAFFSRAERPLTLFLLVFSYILSSALLGGIMTACFSLLNRYSPPISNESDDVPVWIFCLVTALSFLGTLLGGRHFRKRAGMKTTEFRVTLGNRTITLRALVDSGHLLTDTLSGKPVLLAEAEVARHLLPSEYSLPQTWEPDALSCLPTSLSHRIRPIPADSATGHTLLVALRPDEVCRRDSTGTHTVEALIGFTDLRGLPEDCAAIAPLTLLH